MPVATDIINSTTIISGSIGFNAIQEEYPHYKCHRNGAKKSYEIIFLNLKYLGQKTRGSLANLDGYINKCSSFLAFTAREEVGHRLWCSWRSSLGLFKTLAMFSW